MSEWPDNPGDSIEDHPWYDPDTGDIEPPPAGWEGTAQEWSEVLHRSLPNVEEQRRRQNDMIRRRQF